MKECIDEALKLSSRQAVAVSCCFSSAEPRVCEQSPLRCTANQLQRCSALALSLERPADFSGLFRSSQVRWQVSAVSVVWMSTTRSGKVPASTISRKRSIPQPLNRISVVWFALFLAISVSGCSVPVASTGQSDSLDTGASKPLSWEAGVVLAGHPGYLCLSLENIGLNPDDEVRSVVASCDCIEPRLVRYNSTVSGVVSGILLQYVNESVNQAGSLETAAANLGVIVTTTLRDGRTHRFSVSLLHTHLVEGELEP